MPSALPPMQLASLTQSSRFREIPGVSIELPSSTYSLYFYDYLGVWSEFFPENDISSEVGDVLNIQSDGFSGNFIINKIISTSSYYSSAFRVWLTASGYEEHIQGERAYAARARANRLRRYYHRS